MRRDGSENRCLYQHSNEEFIAHETWPGAGEELALVHWPFALKRLSPNYSSTGTATTRAHFETIAAFNAWHIAPNRRGTETLCDTHHPDQGFWLVGVNSGDRSLLCWAGASCQGSQWRHSRYALKQDFERAAMEKSVLSWMGAKADTVYGPQWTHPPPGAPTNASASTIATAAAQPRFTRRRCEVARRESAVGGGFLAWAVAQNANYAARSSLRGAGGTVCVRARHHVKFSVGHQLGWQQTQNRSDFCLKGDGVEGSFCPHANNHL